MVVKKSIAVSIILSIVTCGIYMLYWIASITNDVGVIRHDNNYRSGGMVVLLTIVTCGIYGFYWYFTTSRDIYNVEQDLNMRTSDNAVINLLLSIFGLSIVAIAIMQSSVNDLSDALYAC